MTDDAKTEDFLFDWTEEDFADTDFDAQLIERMCVAGDEDAFLGLFDSTARQPQAPVADNVLVPGAYDRQVATELVVELGWAGRREYEVIQLILDASDNKRATKKRLVELGRGGVTIDEMELAFEMRQMWLEYVPVERITRGWSYHSVQRLPSNAAPTWWTCIRLIRCFDALPAVEEILRMVAELHHEWLAETADYGQQRLYAPAPPSMFFSTYCRERLDSLLASEPCVSLRWGGNHA